ncbi:N-hydroxyarylamine O-acetyltransferase [Prauserella marina]|uniref:N-hydroxyarylamine O-acetyltransferase n=1 Tax=Prauserella marina TaxID=530584 RepID=A0A1G6RCK6_9PSEU|nr:arylamine N-acetyltransferase [Prauserella marina]PWV76987.1 N-hydroxyarylamine O-acetyltransferase [Prauserella marina]SDD01795.1 N-hydroxyarylamine O-acetyltransferase [Prauserella marina]
MTTVTPRTGTAAENARGEEQDRERDEDLWGTRDFDLAGYLGRVGQPHAPPSLEALRALHEAHIRAIPFENLDGLRDVRPLLDLDSLTRKLVHDNRGGYCYEQNGLFAAALETLGYPVTRIVARVQPQRNGPRTHMNLIVRLEGQDYLADVGFGASMFQPMPLREGVVVDQAGWPHRLRREEGLWVLDKRSGETWETQYSFDTSPQAPVDYEVFNHYTATHPRSPFTGRIVVMRLSHGVSRKLIGDELIIERPDGSTEKTPVPPERLAPTLRELGLDLTGELLEQVRQRYAGVS